MSAAGIVSSKITLGTLSSNAEGARIEVWGWGGVLPLTRKIFSILDLKWANFGVNVLFVQFT